MIFRLGFFVAFLVFFSFQKLSAQHGDCETALSWTDSVFVINRAPQGFGKTRELLQDKAIDSTSFKTENNAVWLHFSVEEKSEFCFLLTPTEIKDDFDFVLIKQSAISPCDSVKKLSGVSIIRSNITRNDPMVKSTTGIGPNGTHSREKIGKGNSFSSLVELMPGNYFLVIGSARQPMKGFTLTRSLRVIPEPVDPNLLWMEEQKKLVKQQLNLFFQQKDSLKAVKASGNIRFVNTGVDAAFKDSISLHIPFKEELKVSFIAPGFEPLVKLYKPKEDSLLMTDTVWFKRLQVDSVFDFSQIYFEGNTAVFLPGSEYALMALVDLMKANPGLKIEIQGHVNGPRQKNTREFRRLSEDRAWEIKRYLMVNEIKKNRIVAEGYGNTRMIFPEPQSPEEGEKNRRVEIKILKLE
jgi:outer membrane protein OmpA-like peptidoglycan-associated protein